MCRFFSRLAPQALRVHSFRTNMIKKVKAGERGAHCWAVFMSQVWQVSKMDSWNFSSSVHICFIWMSHWPKIIYVSSAKLTSSVTFVLFICSDDKTRVISWFLTLFLLLLREACTPHFGWFFGVAPNALCLPYERCHSSGQCLFETVFTCGCCHTVESRVLRVYLCFNLSEGDASYCAKHCVECSVWFRAH